MSENTKNVNEEVVEISEEELTEPLVCRCGLFICCGCHARWPAAAQQPPMPQPFFSSGTAAAFSASRAEPRIEERLTLMRTFSATSRVTALSVRPVIWP